MAPPLTVEEIERVVHHVFLPPKLPLESDDNVSELALIDITLTAIESLRHVLLPDLPLTALDNAVVLLANLKAINRLPCGATDEAELCRILITLPVGRTLAVNVSAQNAAVLITRRQDEVIFEQFELSPTNEAVVKTKGRLVRTFPGLAVAVSATLLSQSDFASMVASSLATMDLQKVKGMQPQSRKAGHEPEEFRDTAAPAKISEVWMGVLRPLGHDTAVSAISKSTRDEVLWDSALAPWRRSPMWLLIRVALQLVISRSADGSPELYKEVMLFVMSDILQSALRLPNFPTDVIYVMKAKIQRRLQKLSGAGLTVFSNAVMSRIKSVLQQASDTLSSRWTGVQQRQSRNLQLCTLKSLKFVRDTWVAPPELDDYIAATLSRKPDMKSSPFSPSSQLIKNSLATLPSLPEHNSKVLYYAAANLHQFEQWVAQQLDDWLENDPQDDSCKRLYELMARYHFLASNHYSTNPEAISVMVLTIFELWVASDKVAVRIKPLLYKFDPGIPLVALQNLLLPLLDQMQRLGRVEAYVENRRTRSTKSTKSLFDMQSGDNFACEYFSGSKVHQLLLSTIEASATAARQAKMNELRQLKLEYLRLDALCHQTEHSYRTVVVDDWCVPPDTREVHEGSCMRCFFVRQRAQLSITVHEWPLPTDSYEAKTVVFELQVPSWFAYWRDARFFLLQDVLKGKGMRVQAHKSYLLSKTDPHLTKAYFESSASHRIGLISETKPWIGTHYSSKDNIVALSTSEVCLRSGLQYKYYDSSTNVYVCPITFDNTVPQACTYSPSYPAIQRFIFRPASAPDGPEPNTVLASQEFCPDHMVLGEYKELATIPLGRHIQWENILLQLAMPSVDFRKPETTLVILQCIYQAGPPSSSTLRDSHEIFRSEERTSLLVKNLTEALQRVKENWGSSQAIHIFVAIAARALSLSASVVLQGLCLTFLKSARDVTIGWVIDLREKAHQSDDHAEKTVFVRKSVEMALICALTYDVDDHHLPQILAEGNNASILVQSSIAVHEGEHSHSSGEQHFILLELRFQRTLYRLYKILSHYSEGIDDAIQKSWSGYLPGSTGWRAVSESADHWLTTETKGASSYIHYNLLNGELLVNGLPLDQPPESYRNHPLYSTLFGKAKVEVVPSAIPGFQFSAKRTFGGCVVELGMANGDLICKASRDGTTFEAVPCSLFGADYPTHFVNDYVHWYSVATNTVQFRPLQEPWNATSPANWTLSRKPEQQKWRLTQAGCSVVGIGSPTAQQVSHVLDPLADCVRIHNVLQSNGKTLNINIPKLRLSFSLAQGSSLLESKEFRSMVIDQEQSIGTLIGLDSKLVLRHRKDGSRIVLIPESPAISYASKHHHIVVTVAKESIYKVHAVAVDVLLCRLLDNGDLGSKLYLAYLHALTSFCLVDPLTCKTGTEQALTILRSAAVRSFDQLSQGHIDMLIRLARLSPGRSYYPVHLRVMQTISWDTHLGFLSQHGHFVSAVKALLLQAEKSKIFFPESKLLFPCLDKIDEHLLQRDNIRSATFRVSSHGAEDFTVQKDVQYTARDRVVASQRALRASTMSALIFRDGTELIKPAPALGYLWQKMSALDLVHGPLLPIEARKVKYDPNILELEHGEGFVVQRLPAFHRWLSMPSSLQDHKFSIIMWLSTMASNPKADVSVLQTTAMFCKSKALAQVKAPEMVSFQPSAGTTCSQYEVKKVVESHLHPLDACPEFRTIARRRDETQNQYHDRREGIYRKASNLAVTKFVDAIVHQWPCEIPHAPQDQGASFATYIDVSSALTVLELKFRGWTENGLLERYLKSLEQILTSFTVRTVQRATSAVNTPLVRPSAVGYIPEQTLFLRQAPGRLKSPLLTSVVSRLEPSAGRSKYEQLYFTQLSESLDALLARDDGWTSSNDIRSSALPDHLDRCKQHADQVYSLLVNALGPSSNEFEFQDAQQWPRLSPAFLLKQLARHRWQKLSDEWKKWTVDYALALTALQRAERLVKLANHEEDLTKELRNVGHQNWNPMDFPESLLLEVESGLMIRQVQEQIAAQMRTPPHDKSAVMQLNMGEGKSSVIVPIVAASLADCTKLVRVVVAKPQSKQMAQMLISKLGGLLDRQVYYLPFSRSLILDRAAASAISSMLHDCMSNGGILLVQPEHILSFKLMGPECYISGKEGIGEELVVMQDFLDHNSRDVIDESDESFNVLLIYTMGMQRSIELSPDRWLLLQQVLGLVRTLAPEIAKELPLSLEHIPGVVGGFSRIRILRPDADAMLMQRLADEICKKGLDGLPIHRQPSDLRRAIHKYMTNFSLTTADVDAVECSTFWTDTTTRALLLIRGLIAGGILSFALAQKRWRVNYGLATRVQPTQLVVPYRAKDSPSPRSEFSHPDVVIILTSLSYYYGGLSDEDIFTAMALLMESDKPDIEYQAWVQDAYGLPAAFRQLQGINLKDRSQCTSEIFPALRYAKSVIDYFLAQFVFPKEMKEFPDKLTASGWDIWRRKRLPVTGFSGTNDLRCLLPIDVDHLDPPEQKHTSALVLENILQPENGVELMDLATQNTSDAKHLLDKALSLNPPVQVILDVGAQILELDNRQVAETWLSMHDSTKQAAVFVNESDELMVIDRDGRIDPLRTSSFFTRLDACLIFLDEAHTRGIDLVLPTRYRAAVTLGAGLTKDRLVQACMRMRKLGAGQTVVFCISPEIQEKIQERTNKIQRSDITVADVLVWSIYETHIGLRRSMPLWAVQGEVFVRHEKRWREMKQDGQTKLSQRHAEEFLEAEAQSLQDRYRPRLTHESIQPFSLLDTSDPSLLRIVERCKLFEDLQFNSSTLQEEQERELSPEVEQERQIEKAPPAQPAPHSLHADVQNFALSGVFSRSSKAYMPAFRALEDCSAAKDFALAQLAGNHKLFVTVDFIKTVKPSGSTSDFSDAFQRHVQWLLTTRVKGTNTVDRILILSPYEANKLFPSMWHSRAATLHVYKPCCNSGYAPLDALDFYTTSAQTPPPTVPRALAIELNLFAGQLYISSYEDYVEICKFLGLCAQTLTEEMSAQGWKVAADGFILADAHGHVGGDSGIQASPVNFFKVLLSKIRRNGDGIGKTHMGDLLEGKLLQASDFER